jgi:hypothetical protein
MPGSVVRDVVLFLISFFPHYLFYYRCNRTRQILIPPEASEIEIHQLPERVYRYVLRRLRIINQSKLDLIEPSSFPALRYLAQYLLVYDFGLRYQNDFTVREHNRNHIRR